MTCYRDLFKSACKEASISQCIIIGGVFNQLIEFLVLVSYIKSNIHTYNSEALPCVWNTHYQLKLNITYILYDVQYY